MRIIIIGLLAGIGSFSASAQVQFGIKAGVNFSTLTGSDVSDASTKVGFQGGVFVGVPVGGSFCLQLEQNYSMQGAKASETGSDLSLNQNYLNTAALIKYKHKSGFFAESGPQIGFLTSATITGGGVSEDVRSLYKSTDFSWAFGFGYLVKSINTGIDARYNLGLTNNEVIGSNGSVKNSVIQVGVFYVLGGGK
jgi:hypothetical protein